MFYQFLSLWYHVFVDVCYSTTVIFVDLLGENAGGQGAALGFQYYGNGPIVSVLASKTSRKFLVLYGSLCSFLISWLSRVVGVVNLHCYWFIVNDIIGRI
jgi:hypothetical protein